jgi:hypothetical protein
VARTDSTAVKALLRNGSEGGDYDDVHSPDLTYHIRVANSFVTRVNTCATAKGYSLTSDELTDLETAMAAHFYTKSDRVYQSKSTAGASGAFVLDPQNPEPYKSMAIEMDPSGCVSALLNRQRAAGFWLGRPPSEQTDYVDRD